MTPPADRVILCMKWGTLYPADYVNVLYSACRRHITGPFRFLCLTDDSTGFSPGIETRPIPDLGLTQGMWKSGAWAKLGVFQHDLYGFTGRALFIDLVQREILVAKRMEQHFGVLFIDLDRFKAVNDTMGHSAGDELLVELSRRMREMLREADVVCRQSGDEFLVLARDVEHWEALGEMAQRILKSVELPVSLEHGNARVSGSIGIALFPDDADNFETLVKNADVAMYQAKALGRARYSFFHAELNDRLVANSALDQELGEAIATRSPGSKAARKANWNAPDDPVVTTMRPSSTVTP